MFTVRTSGSDSSKPSSDIVKPAKMGDDHRVAHESAEGVEQHLLPAHLRIAAHFRQHQGERKHQHVFNDHAHRQRDRGGRTENLQRDWISDEPAVRERRSQRDQRALRDALVPHEARECADGGKHRKRAHRIGGEVAAVDDIGDRPLR